MRVEKDVIIAVIIGILIGSLAALAIFFLPKFLAKPSFKLKKEEVVKKEVTISPTPSFFLNIKSPQDEALFLENKILVSGKTISGAFVAVVSPGDEAVVEADSEGAFETEILLEEGANEISLTAYADNQEETKSVTVYYTKEEME